MKKIARAICYASFYDLIFEMKRKSIIIVVVIGVLILAGIGLYLLAPATLFRGIESQMKAGRSFMDSLTEEDIQSWTIRADRLLANHDPASPDEIPVPDDLKALKIQRVYVYPPGRVAFMWVTGFDHTALIIDRDASGHTVTALYNDEERRQLWP